MLLVHLFVCFASCSLPLVVEGWLRFLIMALPDFSINFFVSFDLHKIMIHVFQNRRCNSG